MTTTFLRPNTIAIDRRIGGTVSPTGEPALIVTPIAAGVTALLDPVTVTGNAGGGFEMTIEGKLYTQSHVMIVDGLAPKKFAGSSPGATVTVAGLPYVVAPNGRGAFVDVRPGDRITDEAGRTFLVLGVERYYETLPNLQARVVLGEASNW